MTTERVRQAQAEVAALMARMIDQAAENLGHEPEGEWWDHARALASWEPPEGQEAALGRLTAESQELGLYDHEEGREWPQGPDAGAGYPGYQPTVIGELPLETGETPRWSLGRWLGVVFSSTTRGLAVGAGLGLLVVLPLLWV